MKVEADKACTDMVKIGATYDRGQGVYSVLMKKLLLKPSRNTTRKNPRKNTPSAKIKLTQN